MAIRLVHHAAVRGFILVALVAATLALTPQFAGQCADAPAATIRLVVDYGDGAEIHFTALPWREGQTVLDALSAAQSHPHGITFSARGSGSSALVTAIGNLKNQGGGDQAKNWMFYVNSKRSEVGAGAYKLHAGDAILWRFQVYE
jgi:hypothetical protein